MANDLAFDSRLPLEVRQQSPSHFTPVDVAHHVAALVAPNGGETVLDVGAGAGKFCLAAAHSRPNARFVGVELRPHLVAIARRLAAEWQLPNARFIHADAFDLDWSEFDAFYFFNPFAEHLFHGAFRLDDTLSFDPATHTSTIETTLARLARARAGTRVVTYHGLGADLPTEYELASVDLIGSDRVELWIHTGTSFMSSRRPSLRSRAARSRPG